MNYYYKQNEELYKNDTEELDLYNAQFKKYMEYDSFSGGYLLGYYDAIQANK